MCYLPNFLEHCLLSNPIWFQLKNTTCVNDCIIYRGANKDCTHCPQCGESRFSGQTPRKRFKYLPLGPRIRRYFSNARTSQLLQNHATTPDPEDIHDIHHTEVWKKWYSHNGIFSGDSRGLALGVCIDGTNPFAKEKNSCSMSPITVSFLNLPPSLRRLHGYLQLVGIIPGKSEPKNTDPYLSILVDELIELNGSVVFDGYQNSTFLLQVALLLQVLDYPGQTKVFHCHGES